MTYRGIFFDIGWTLMYPRKSWFLTDLFYEMVTPDKLALTDISTALQTSMPVLTKHHRMDTLDQEEKQFRQFYRTFLSNVPTLGLDNHAADILAHDKVYNNENYIFFEDVLPILIELKGSYRLGIISDTWPSAINRLKHAGIYELFDSITFSYQLGIFRPDSRIYKQALYSMGLPAHQTILVDDSPENLSGVADEGIFPIQICASPDSPTPNCFQYISAFKELPSLLRRLS